MKSALLRSRWRFGVAGAFAMVMLDVLGACAGGRGPEDTAMARPGVLAETFRSAFRADATGDANDAGRAYLDVVARAAGAPNDPWQVPALEASLAALAETSLPALDVASRDAAVAFRTPAGPAVTHALTRDEEAARGPFARGLVARALLELAERRGDAAAAETARRATGCAREAVVLRTRDWTPVTGVHTPDPLDRADARIEDAYKLGGAFDPVAHPITVRGRGCAIDLSAETGRPGVRDVVVDVVVPGAQTIGVVLRAHGAAVLRAGGAVVVNRPFELGDGEAARFARVAVAGGTVRLVARVGTAKEDDAVEIDVFGEDGAPLPTGAPAVGSRATGRALQASELPAPTPRRDDEILLAGAAALAAGDPRTSERTTWAAATRSDAPPDLSLVYARAVESARDLSPAIRGERARNAYSRALEAWPSSWEGIIGHAVLAGVRRGREEAGIETLRDLDELRPKASVTSAPMLDAFEALVAAREKLFDRARSALSRASKGLAGTELLVDAEDAAEPREGADRAERACDLTRPTAHDSLACLAARQAVGDRAGQAAEIARLRALFGAPSRFLPIELRAALVDGAMADARHVFDAMLPAERTVAELASLSDGAPGERAALLAIASSSRDAPAAMAPLLRSAGDDPGAAFDGMAEQIADDDRRRPILANAATAVLAHIERYDISRQGLLHWVLFDERRVSGTMDVDENAQAAAPDVLGRAVQRMIRRRILKSDGRILEPDRAPRAAQAHADLSQLEQGDIVEAIYEGWALPGDSGDVGLDTPDLLPERTAVHAATIELRLPRDLRGSLWSHATLGKPAERDEGGVRVLTWQLDDHPARRIEDGVPKMDRNVSVSFSTANWESIARALRETVADLDEHDPEISAWAREAVAGVGGAKGAAPSPRAAVEALVTAAGKALRESDAGTLSDYGGGIAPVQTESARTFLTSHDGSRAWVVLRGLREIGIPSDLVVAENDPYSADPSFPPHYGRFVHPLVVAHLPDHQGDVWIDADISGPPLPAGRISPELRGRLALHADGTIATLGAAAPANDGARIAATGDADADKERDEVDIRLALDDRGDARGTFAIVLRGREAQELAEALVRIVGAERQHALREVVLAWLPWANVDDVRLTSTDDSWQVRLRADVSVSGYAQEEERPGEGHKTWLLPGLDALHWVWPKARVSSLASTFATQAGRQSALAVSTAVQYHVHRRIELPPGATVARMPGPLDVRAKLVDATREIAVDAGQRSTGGASAAGASTPGGSVVEDDFVLGVATGTISPSDYDAFVAAAHRTDDAFLASTRVAVASSSRAP